MKIRFVPSKWLKLNLMAEMVSVLNKDMNRAMKHMFWICIMWTFFWSVCFVIWTWWCYTILEWQEPATLTFQTLNCQITRCQLDARKDSLFSNVFPLNYYFLYSKMDPYLNNNFAYIVCYYSGILSILLMYLLRTYQ